MRTLFGIPGYSDPIVLYHPWYFCTLQITMDTYLRKGLEYTDLVAVDAVRPVRKRVQNRPEVVKISENTVGKIITSRSTEKMAADESIELLKTIVINRNKLLKQFNIMTVRTELVYLPMYVVPVDGFSDEDWVVIDAYFDDTYTLSNRRELREILHSNAINTKDDTLSSQHRNYAPKLNSSYEPI